MFVFRLVPVMLGDDDNGLEIVTRMTGPGQTTEKTSLLAMAQHQEKYS